MPTGKPAAPKGATSTGNEDRPDRRSTVVRPELGWDSTRGAGLRDRQPSAEGQSGAELAARGASTRRQAPLVGFAEPEKSPRSRSTDPSSRRHLLLTTEVAAEYLAVSVRTIKNLLCEGKLPYIKVGRATRIDAVDLDEYIERNRRRNRRPLREIS